MQVQQSESLRTKRLAKCSEPQAAEWIVRLFGDRKPLGFQAGDENLYRYVKNASTTATDPSGLSRLEQSPGPNGTYHLYYVGTQFGFFGTSPVYVGNYNPTTGLVARNGHQVPYQRVRQAAEAWGIGPNTMPNWNTWFAQNAVETNPGQMGQGVLWRQMVGQDFHNEAVVASAQIELLGNLGIQWMASAGLFVGGSRFVFSQGRWYNASRGTIATPAEIGQVAPLARQQCAAIRNELRVISENWNRLRRAQSLAQARARVAAQSGANPAPYLRDAMGLQQAIDRLANRMEVLLRAFSRLGGAA